MESLGKEKRTRREGAGRPVDAKGHKYVRNVTLDSATIETMKALGGGNLSEGIRKAAEIVGLIS